MFIWGLLMNWKNRQGVSPIIASMLLVGIVLAGVIIVYPMVSATMSAPIYSVGVISTSLIRQGNYIILSANLKNTGSISLSLNCTLYDSARRTYQASPAPLNLSPTESGSFQYESNTTGSNFIVGNEYQMIIVDSAGYTAEVGVICIGR